MPRVALIDYGAGNLHSAAAALRRIPGVEVDVTDVPARLADASHIVLPGVGAFADCMRGLKSVPGMIAALEARVLAEKTPFLGICVGMQMLFSRGHEHGVHDGLGWIDGEVVPIPSSPGLKIPHMGWNDLRLTQPRHQALASLKDGDHAYFVHSYHAETDASHILATTEHGRPLAAIVARDHLLGAQFHPEKSQSTGDRLLRNFLGIP